MPPQDPTPARFLAVAGLIGLLVVFMVMVGLIASGGDDSGSGSQEAAATATATATRTAEPTPTPTPTPSPSPTATPLNGQQQLERQDAVDVVRSRGFDVVRLRDYDPSATLRVLIGRSDDGGEMAFFFVVGEYLGNDSADASAKVRVDQTSDLEVTLGYRIFQPGDEPDRPTGEPVLVEFVYDGSRVQPVDALPAPEERTPGRQVE